jgi:hypothetical protein
MDFIFTKLISTPPLASVTETDLLLIQFPDQTRDWSRRAVYAASYNPTPAKISNIKNSRGLFMNNRPLSALVCLLAGLLFLAVPHKIFPVCGHAGAPAAPSFLGEEAPFAPLSPEASRHLSSLQPGPAGKAPMVCFWTARAEGGLGFLIIFGGLLLLFAKAPERRLGISLMLAGAAVFGAAIPCLLLGVCRGETMPCRAGTLPALLLLSGFFFLFTLLNSLFLLKVRRAQGHG